MNTIPSIFDEQAVVPPPYTIVGGIERAGSSGLSAVLLNRGSRYPRKQVFTELSKAGFDFIVSIENPAEHYEIDELVSVFPHVFFILFSEPASIGEQINIAARELRSPLFFTLWNDTKILYGGAAEKIAEKLLVPPQQMAQNNQQNWYRRLCTTPVFQNNQLETLSTTIAPLLRKNRVETIPYSNVREDAPALYPYQGMGVYDRLRFLRLGGFDNAIKNPYWQLMDFGFRAWLWGEEIRCTHHIRLKYDGLSAIESTGDMEGYRRFYLKNILPVVRKNSENGALYGYLPLKKLLPYLFSSAGNTKGSEGKFRTFFKIRQWVQEHQHNWKNSIDMILQNWEECE